MKIKEYAANVVEYTEVVDAPYNLTSDEEVLDERPMGFVKGGLQKLGSKLLPGSYGRAMTGKVKLGTQANKLYGDFHEFLGQSGYQSTDDAVRAFLQQSGINVDIDSILKKVSPAANKGFNVKLPQKPSPAPAAAPVTESINRILVLSGRSPKKIINEEVALDRAALNKIFMQVAQQQMGGKGGVGAAAPTNIQAPSAAPTPQAPAAKTPTAAPTTQAPTAAPKVAAPRSGDFGGDGPAAAPAVAPPTSTPPASNAPLVAPPSAEPATPAPAVKSPAPTTAKQPAANPKQSIQDVNKYLNNVAVQSKNPDLTPQQRSELAKELINFMADRKGTPEYDNAIGGAQKLVKKLDPRLNTRLATGKTAVQKPQGIRNPPKAPPAPVAASAPAPKAATAAPQETPAQKRTRELGAAGRGLAESKILDRNSYIFLKDVLENTNLSLRDLGYRVSVSESTSNSVTLITR